MKTVPILKHITTSTTSVGEGVFCSTLYYDSTPIIRAYTSILRMNGIPRVCHTSSRKDTDGSRVVDVMDVTFSRFALTQHLKSLKDINDVLDTWKGDLDNTPIAKGIMARGSWVDRGKVPNLLWAELQKARELGELYLLGLNDA